jgi:hypothetical protein
VKRTERDQLAMEIRAAVKHVVAAAPGVRRSDLKVVVPFVQVEHFADLPNAIDSVRVRVQGARREVSHATRELMRELQRRRPFARFVWRLRCLLVAVLRRWRGGRQSRCTSSAETDLEAQRKHSLRLLHRGDGDRR